MAPTPLRDHRFAQLLVTKTLHGGLTMAALAKELDVNPYQQLVADLLPESTADANGCWEGVTLEHLLT